MKEEAQNHLKESSKEVFKKFPDLKSFAWTQYTPYFNDGDVCVFEVYRHYPYLNGSDDQEYDSAEADEISKLLGAFEEDDLKAAFGDHVKVTIHRDGKVETEDYEHD